ncbi:Transcriptional activator, partial [Lunasporangiospora selenospora]
YLHESRHKHAMRRPRGPGGRFLTATEIAAMDKEKPDTEVGDLGDVTSGGQGVDGGAFDQSLHHESYQVQHHRQQLKHEELLQQQQLRMQQQQLQQSLPQPRQVYETGL